MAEDKKSIIVYADWIDKFEECTDDEAGRLIKHFFRYVNDLNPEAPDRITKLLFTDIKNTLKRDLNKYAVKKEERSNAGKLGNLKKYNKDLYDKVVSKELSLNVALDILDSRKDSHSDAKDTLATKTLAKLAVSDSVSVSGSDISNNTLPTANVDIDFNILLKFINEKTKRGFKVINKSVKDKYKARLKDGYTKDDIKNCIINACNDPYHKDTNNKYLTPDYFSRQKTLDLHAYKTIKKEVKHIDNPYGDQFKTTKK